MLYSVGFTKTALKLCLINKNPPQLLLICYNALYYYGLNQIKLEKKNKNIKTVCVPESITLFKPRPVLNLKL